MEEEASSWIRRTNFSHTVCHRLDSARSASFPFTIEPERISGLTSSRKPVSDRRPSSSAINSPIQINPITNKLRSVSPLPETVLSDAFKEAKSDKKRFSTPHPRRKDQYKVSRGQSFNKDEEKSRNKKDSALPKFFDHAGGRVNGAEASNEWNVDMSKLFLGLRFAHGAHSKLYHGLYKDEAVAVKIIRVPDDDENGDLAARLENQFTREVTLLSRLHHPNVIKFMAACKKPPVYCIITEYLTEGSLRAFLHKLERKELPLEKQIGIALDVAYGMEYIHSQGVIHRDLKPENILIDQEFHFKIADFGIACEEAYCDFLADDPGTYRWMAPEMIRKKTYGRKVDVYSFGLILWELAASTIPYEDMNPIQAAFAVVNKNLRPVIPENCPPAMRALIEQCWSLKPDHRPDFWQIVKVLEQFKSSLAHDGTLNLIQNPTCQDHKKGLLHWIQKLVPTHPSSATLVPKPKFA